MTPEHDHEQRSYRRLADEGRVDGVLLTDLYVDDPRPALLAELGLPALLVGPALPDTYWPALGVDDSPGIVAAVEHLVGHGHTRIAHVGGTPDMVHGRSRRLAWSTALRDAGLPEAPCVDTDFSADAGAAATRQLLDLADPPTAIVYANDLMAIAGLAVAAHRGIDVPGRLSVTGYDDTELAAYVRPGLTSVRVDIIGWGRAAAVRLLEIAEQRPLTEADLPPPALVVRGSTGPAPRATADPHRSTRSPNPTFGPSDPAGHERENPDENQARHRNPERARARGHRRLWRWFRRLGGSTSSTGPIKVWLSNNPEEIAWGKQMVKDWNAQHPDQEVTAQEIPAGKTSEAVIGAAITAGNAPCLVFNTAPAAVPQFQKQGGLVALDDFGGATDYIESRSGDVASQYQSTDGKYYQIPWKSNPVMIFYNKDIFKKAGIDPENPPLSTYDDFLATSRKIVESGAAQAAIWPAPTSEFFQSWFDFYPMYAAETGGQQLVEDGQATFDSEAGTGVADLWSTMYADGLAPKETYNGDSFADGKAAMATVGPWAVAVYGKDVNWGVAPVPTAEGKSPEEIYTFSDAKNIALYSACENQQTAFDVLKFATSEEQDGKLLEMTGQMPLRTDLESTYPDYFKEHPEYQVFADQASRTVEVPNVPNSVEIWQTFRDAWSSSVIFGKSDVQDSLGSAADEINNLAGQS